MGDRPGALWGRESKDAGERETSMLRKWSRYEASQSDGDYEIAQQFRVLC